MAIFLRSRLLVVVLLLKVSKVFCAKEPIRQSLSIFKLSDFINEVNYFIQDIILKQMPLSTLSKSSILWQPEDNNNKCFVIYYYHQILLFLVIYLMTNDINDNIQYYINFWCNIRIFINKFAKTNNLVDIDDEFISPNVFLQTRTNKIAYIGFINILVRYLEHFLDAEITLINLDNIEKTEIHTRLDLSIDDSRRYKSEQEKQKRYEIFIYRKSLIKALNNGNFVVMIPRINSSQRRQRGSYFTRYIFNDEIRNHSNLSLAKLKWLTNFKKAIFYIHPMLIFIALMIKSNGLKNEYIPFMNFWKVICNRIEYNNILGERQLIRPSVDISNEDIDSMVEIFKEICDEDIIIIDRDDLKKTKIFVLYYV